MQPWTSYWTRSRHPCSLMSQLRTVLTRNQPHATGHEGASAAASFDLLQMTFLGFFFFWKAQLPVHKQKHKNMTHTNPKRAVRVSIQLIQSIWSFHLHHAWRVLTSGAIVHPFIVLTLRPLSQSSHPKNICRLATSLQHAAEESSCFQPAFSFSAIWLRS